MASANQALGQQPGAQATRAAERPVPSRTPLRATLTLDFALDASTAQTILSSSHQQPPLKVVRAFSRHDGSALAHLHNVSGGLLGGDELALAARVGPGANVQLTTTGATRVYRPSAESADVVQTNEIAVTENALLEYVPDPLIPYALARFRQRTSIHLAQGSGLFWWEIFSPGREARGELFEYESLAIATDVFAAGRLIAAERVRIEPGTRAPASLARLGPFRYWAAFYICRVGLDSAIWLALERRLREVAAGLPSRGHTAWGISSLVAHGLVIRCLAERGSDIQPGLLALWRAAKVSLYGAEPIPPRKIH
jgi:urease accessory protein